MARIDSISFASIPPPVKDLLLTMLTRYPHRRISVHEIENAPYFNNILVSTIKYLDFFAEKDQSDKVQYLKGLVRILPQFSAKLCKTKVAANLIPDFAQTFGGT